METQQAPTPKYGKNCSLEDYVALLETSYTAYQTIMPNAVANRLDYLCGCVFDFVTYDDKMSTLFATKALEVCKAINDANTHEYICKSSENYTWYITMCNMEFFKGRINWGTSIRGAWWDHKDTSFYNCQIWINDKQITEPIKFLWKEWIVFINALSVFAEKDKVSIAKETAPG